MITVSNFKKCKKMGISGNDNYNLKMFNMTMKEYGIINRYLMKELGRLYDLKDVKQNYINEALKES